jgi:heptose-I-phosphate ethanolaminephosphotransferase
MKLNRTNQSNVPTIVIVIGESLNKTHCSLYGYEKNTNPILSQMPDSLLHVFANVQSPATGTLPSFCCFMTTSDNTDASISFNYPNIIEISQKSGYKLTWISNQSEKGLYDNGVAKLAHIADSTIWNGNRYSGMQRMNKDGELLDIINNYNSSSSNNVVIVHLMGSHEEFSRRYPSSYAIFKTSDYQKFPENQRSRRAEYDNSVLYNDYVVSSIFKTYSNQDAVVLYFSDHAIDIFEGDPNFCGHAMPGNKKSEQVSKLIPFMIYTSPKFRENHKDLTSMIEQSVDIDFNTTDLPYMVMQLLGVTFSDRENESPLIATY